MIENDNFRKKKKKKGFTILAVINYSFSLQYAQQKHFPERIHLTSEMNSIRYYVESSYIDFVALDVDNTLITSDDPYYNQYISATIPLGQRKSKHALFNSSTLGKRDWNNIETFESRRDLFDLVSLRFRPWAVIEPQTIQWIADMQTKGIKVMAVTSLWAAINKNLGIHIPKWRIKHLKQLGYDFSKSFFLPTLYGFNRLNSNNPFEPYFEKGILFSGNVSKGMALLSLFQTISMRPKSVLFIDDNLDNILSVYQELSRVNIKCRAFFYTRMEKNPTEKLISRENYFSSLKKQIAAVEEFVMLEKINKNQSNTFTPITWLAPKFPSPSLKEPSLNKVDPKMNCNIS